MKLPFCGDVLGGTGRDDLPAAGAAFGTKIDHPVGGLDDIQVVFYDDDRIPAVHEPLEHFEQLVDVRKMKSGRRLVQKVERPARIALAELGGKFYALGLAAG